MNHRACDFSIILIVWLVLFAMPQNTFSQTTEVCDNQVDDDGDGFVDCEDEDCLVDGYTSSLLTAKNPRHINFADLDSDSDLDIIVCDYESSGSANIFLNAGNGEFVLLDHQLGSWSQRDAAIGDIDNDGDLDYVTNSGSTLYVVRDEGGVFEQKNTNSYGYCSGISSIQLVDLNLDNYLDLIIGFSSTSCQSEVRLNDGSGNFILQSFFGPSSETYFQDVIDLDGDGDLDVVDQGYEPTIGYRIKFYMNQGSGVMVDTGNYIEGCSGYSTLKQYSFGDYDSDGDSDLAFLKVSGNTTCLYEPVTIFDNDGEGNFQVSAFSVWSFLGLSPNQTENVENATFVDVDVDGDLDLFLGYASSGLRCRILINDGTGEYSQVFETGPKWLHRNINFVNLDSDPQLELVGGNYGSGVNEVFQINEEGSISSGLEVVDEGFSDFINSQREIQVFDLDMDGIDEVFVRNEGGLNRISKLSSEGSFEVLYVLPVYNCYGFDVADVNGDGFLDICYSGNSAFTGLSYGDGFGGFVNSNQFFGLNNGVLRLADVDGDQLVDFVLQKTNQDDVFEWYRNQGGDSFEFMGSLFDQDPNYNCTRGLEFQDVNSDGHQDVITLGGCGYPNLVFFGDSTGVFVDSGQTLGSYDTQEIAFGDLDNDGDVDFVSANLSAPNVVWINDGSGFFFSLPDNQHLLGGSSSSAYSVDLGDIDFDGDLDVLFGENCTCTGSSFIAPVYLNSGNASFLPGSIELPNSTNSYSSQRRFSDVNQDGKIDYVLGTQFSFHLMKSINGCGVDDDLDGIPNSCDTDLVSGDDCDGDGQLDLCQFDQDNDGVIDECDPDVDGDGVLNPCDPDQSAGSDCNTNGILDDCDTAEGTSADCDSNNIPDECEYIEGADCNFNGLLDVCEGIAFVDCNVNGINDLCDVAAGVSADCNQDGIPDSCQYDSDPDCNQNGFLDSCDILQGFSDDCDGNLIPDDCELDLVTDSDSNGILDVCEGLGFRRGDSNGDGSLDVSDAVNVLEVIFGSASSTCLDAADFNDDGDLNIADAVYGLATLFSGGATPPDPGPDSCGFDPTEDQLDCQSYSGC